MDQNFIDGVNTNLTLYNIIILTSLANYQFYFDLKLLLIILSTFCLFNFFGKCFWEIMVFMLFLY